MQERHLFFDMQRTCAGHTGNALDGIIHALVAKLASA
jgi:hypothetical protein